MSEVEDSLDFEDSKLGTLQYWNNEFAKDLEIYKDTKSIGEIWFGEESIKRIVCWFNNNKIFKDSQILDIGCGNGATLFKLYKEGYTNLMGIDYSESAIELANSVATENEQNIAFKHLDILDCLQFNSVFDICLDKGTYDAICLNPIEPYLQRQKYRESVYKLCKKRGFFLITSCNWTEDELTSFFESHFNLVEKIDTPTFNFGGQLGNKETVLVFRKNEQITLK